MLYRLVHSLFYSRVNSPWCPFKRKLTPKKVNKMTAKPIMAIIAALRPRHPMVSRWWSNAAYKSQVIPDQTSFGSQLQNLPQTDFAYTKPEIRPRVSMVNPAMINAYPVVSSSSRDGRRLKKNPRCFDLMACSWIRCLLVFSDLGAFYSASFPAFFIISRIEELMMSLRNLFAVSELAIDLK